MWRAEITDLNGVKMETSSGHTLTCQPHFPRVDPMSTAVPSLTTPIPPSFPPTPSLFPRLHRVPPLPPSSLALPGQVWRPEIPPLLPQRTHIHTLCPLSAALKADLLFKLMARYVKQT